MAETKDSPLAELVKSALERDAREWPEFLQQACGDDLELRAEAESLLNFHGQADRILEQPAIHLGAGLFVDDDTFQPGERVDHYEILSLIGTGGMGEVYLAQDTELGRKVALKFIKRGFGWQNFTRHFRAEEKIVAGLNHPNIAQLYGAGAANGTPYFVMEYVDGVPLDKFCDERGLGLHERLRVFGKVCAAVAYAHQNLVIHRDIKPANILVNAGGEPKLLDFGIAKLFDPAASDALEQTITLAAVMTPEYASPEQVRGETMTTASDVYSLGVVLYELLTGAKPYTLTSRKPHEISRAIIEQESTRPSTAVRSSSLQLAGKTQSKSWATSLRGDIDNIVLKAMRKEPARRYASVPQFSEDISRYLDGRPIIARKDTLTYRASKFVRRNRIAVAAAALIFLAILGGLTVSVWQARVARQERDNARAEQAKAQRINAFMQELLGFANPGWFSPSLKRGKDVTIGQVLDEAAGKLEDEFANQPQIKAELQRSIGSSYMYEGRYDVAEHFLRAALDTFNKLHGDDDPDTARTLLHLGDTLLWKGDFRAAEPLFARALKIYRKEKGNPAFEPRWYAGVAGDLGNAYKSMGSTERAESSWKEALDLAPQLYGNDKAAVAILRANVASVNSDRGDLDGAEALYRQSKEEFDALPNRERWELGPTLTGLADILVTKGKLEEAHPLLLAAADLYRKSLGNSSAYLGRNLDSQARLLLLKGDLVGAEATINQAADIFKRVLPEGHPVRLVAIVTQALVMNKAGHSEAAEIMLRSILDGVSRAFPPGHYQTALAKGALGECLLTQRRYNEAEPFLIESYESLKASQGATGARTKIGLLRLIALYDNWGRSDVAAKYRSDLSQFR